jgi:hypothetical protein
MGREPDSTYETVETATPASLAMSTIVTTGWQLHESFRRIVSIRHASTTTVKGDSASSKAAMGIDPAAPTGGTDPTVEPGQQREPPRTVLDIVW